MNTRTSSGPAGCKPNSSPFPHMQKGGEAMTKTDMKHRVCWTLLGYCRCGKDRGHGGRHRCNGCDMAWSDDAIIVRLNRWVSRSDPWTAVTND